MGAASGNACRNDAATKTLKKRKEILFFGVTAAGSAGRTTARQKSGQQFSESCWKCLRGIMRATRRYSREFCLLSTRATLIFHQSCIINNWSVTLCLCCISFLPVLQLAAWIHKTEIKLNDQTTKLPPFTSKPSRTQTETSGINAASIRSQERNTQSLEGFRSIEKEQSWSILLTATCASHQSQLNYRCSSPKSHFFPGGTWLLLS